MPIFIIDPVGTLIFYNESAEPILGCRYEEMGELTREQGETQLRVRLREFGSSLDSAQTPTDDGDRRPVLKAVQALCEGRGPADVGKRAAAAFRVAFAGGGA